MSHNWSCCSGNMNIEPRKCLIKLMVEMYSLCMRSLIWLIDIFFSVSIDTVKEIRCGKNTDVFRDMDRDDFQEDCAFSIIYSDSFETLNLVAYSPDEANIWVTGLRCLLDSDKGKTLLKVSLYTVSKVMKMQTSDSNTSGPSGWLENSDR